VGRLVIVLAVLAAANLLNNRVAPAAYVVTCVVAALLAVLVARLDGCTWADLGLGRGTVRRGLAWGGAAAGLVFACYLVAATVPAGQTAFTGDRAAGLSGGHVLWNALVRVPFGTVLLEEVAFRSVLLAMVAKRYGFRAAVGVSSLLFGVWHVLPALGLSGRNDAVAEIMGSGPASTAGIVLAAVAATALAGVVFCELRRRSGSLLASMGLHWAVNGLGFGFSWAVSRAVG
jgi:membrane protease YdiL (CAAX protease family)